MIRYLFRWLRVIDFPLHVQVELDTEAGELSVQGDDKHVDGLFPSVVDVLVSQLPHAIETVS